jgi:acetate kinase
MNDAVIVLNAGSSSLKFSIYRVVGAELTVEARGQIEGLGTAPHFIAKDQNGVVLADSALDRGEASGAHAHAFAHLARFIRAEFAAELKPLAVGHRVVHGGADFAGPTLIDAGVLARLKDLSPLAPLHQPHNLEGIHAVTRLQPDLPQVACFDTAFHRGRAPVTERFGLPDDLYQSGVRRWGFHGLSYESIAGTLKSIAPEIHAGRSIVAHLGSGASLCALRNGRSVDTTMAFSVLDGLPMGTRCGSLDPGVILYLLRRGMDADQLETLLYKKSGLLGMSAVSNDVRELLASDRPSAAAAIEYFVYRIAREIASLTAALGGLDALVFTAGIGENSPVIRQRVCDHLGWLGIQLEPAANQRGRGRISSSSTASVWVIPTDEEHVIATQTLTVVRRQRPGSPTARS